MPVGSVGARRRRRRPARAWRSAPGSADLFFLLGVSDAEAVRLDRPAGRAAPCAGGHLRQGTVAAAVKPAGRARHRGGGRRTAGPMGAALQTRQPRIRAPRRPRRPAVRLRHRPVRAGAVDRRPHPRHDQHRGRRSPTCWPTRRPATRPTSCAGCRSWAAPARPSIWSGSGQWGIFDALRAGGDVVRVDERPELGLRPRLAVGIHLPADRSRAGRPGVRGHDLAAAGVGAAGRRRRGGAARCGGAGGADHVAAGGRPVDAYGAGAGTARAEGQRLRGRGEPAAIARELGIAADGRAALVGFAAHRASRLADVIALSASAFRADAQVASTGERVYVLLPKIGATSSLTSWVRGMVAALRRELGLTLRAVIAAPLAGLAGAAAARAEVDRVFDSADRHPGAIARSRRWTRRTPRCCSTRSSRTWRRRRAARRPAGARTARARSDARRHAAGLSGQLRRHRRGGAAAARASQHGALPRAPDREAVVDVAGRSRCPPAAFAGPAGHRTSWPRAESVVIARFSRECCNNYTFGEVFNAPSHSSSNRSMASSRRRRCRGAAAVGEIPLRIEAGDQTPCARPDRCSRCPGRLLGQQRAGIDVTHELGEREQPRLGQLRRRACSTR